MNDYIQSTTPELYNIQEEIEKEEYYAREYEKMQEEETPLQRHRKNKTDVLNSPDEELTPAQLELKKMLEGDKGTQKLFDAFYEKVKYGVKPKFNHKKLAELLTSEYDLKVNVPVKKLIYPFRLDKKTNTYYQIDEMDIMNICADDMNHKCIIDMDEVERTLKAMNQTIEPDYNIIKFKNGILNLTTMNFKNKCEEATLPYLSLDFNFNPKAKFGKLGGFLNSTFERENWEQTREYILGVLEIIGYMFIPGNQKQKLIIGTGVGGSGKGVLTEILNALFNNKTCHVSLQDLTNQGSRFSKAPLVNSYLNIVNDMSTEYIQDVGKIKEITGNNKIEVEMKGKDSFTLSALQIPKTIAFCNEIASMPDDEALLRRLIIIEFIHNFSETDLNNENLVDEIVNDEGAIEWLIYNSLDAYARMERLGGKFTLAMSTHNTRKVLNKHQDPIAYCVGELITEYELPVDDDYGKPIYYETDPIPSYELNRLVVALAEEEGLALPLTKKGKLSGKRLTPAVSRALEIEEDDYGTVNSMDKYGKQRRVYRGLVKSDKYNTLLAKVMKDEE